MKQTNYTGFEIAVIGMSCRVPGASNVQEFWENLKNGVISISRFSDDELREYGISEDELSDLDYVKAKGIIKNADFFDASFFGLTPKEANTLDPQIRISLQCAYHALEDAGYNFGKERNNVGVFVGAAPNIKWQADCLQKTTNQFSEQFSSILLNDKDFLSSRLSYLMNLHGPSNTIYTACSTSLVAVDMALQSLLTGKCNLAIAGGITLSLPYKSGYAYKSGMMMSKDGNICSFDSKASGTVWGDGAGIVVLKRLEDAIEEGDNIHAIIKGTATNNDGKRKVGYTAYSAKGQIEVINAAYAMAEVEHKSIGYIEGHGSATPLGDQIEVNALMEAFKDVNKDYKCPIGSVKSNLSNLNVASGIVSLIKVCLMLKHSQIPPSVNFQSPNSKLATLDCPFYVNKKLTHWNESEYPLRAGINSFGIGGTNAHIILEKAPVNKSSSLDQRKPIICFSAKTQAGLNKISSNLLEFIKKNESTITLQNLAFTLQTGREHFNYRKFLITDEVKKLIKNLSEEHNTKSVNDTIAVVMMFSEIECFHSKFGKNLYEKETYFKEALNNCFQFLEEYVEKDFKSIIFTNNKSELLNDFQIHQCLEFSFQYAYAILLNSWGIKADYLVGYGVGEYVAACLSGVFNLQTALEILVEKGKLFNQLETGNGLEITMSVNEIEPYLNKQISIVIDNDTTVVVAGSKKELVALQQILEKQSITIKKRNKLFVLHSQELVSIQEQFRQILLKHDLKRPKIPIISSISATWINEEINQPEYWIEHLTKTIHIAKSLDVLIESSPNAVFLNVGNDLSLFKHRINDSKNQIKQIDFIKNSRSSHLDNAFLQNALGTFWEYGGFVNWNAYHHNESKGKQSLPTYPFEEKSYNIQVNNTIESKIDENNLLRKKDLTSWFYVPSWKRVPHIISENNISSENRNILILGTIHLDDLKYILIKKDNLIFAKYADRFKKNNANEYELNYNDKDDLLKLFQHLKTQNLHLNVIIDFMSFNNKQETHHKNLDRTIDLMQVVSETDFNQNKIDYLVICNQVFSIYGNEKINPLKSKIVAAVNSIPQEHLNINCRLIEVDDKTFKTNREKFYKQIFRELETIKINDKIISYRGLNRWVKTIEPYPIASQDSTQSIIKSKGTYIIINGICNSGITLASQLLTANELNIVLIGQSEIPDETKWKDWLNNHKSENETSKKIVKINQLKKLNGNVSAIQVNTTSKKEMSIVFKQTVSNFGKINGVFYINESKINTTNTVLNTIDKNQLQDDSSVKIKELAIVKKLVKNDLVEFVIAISPYITIVGGQGMLTTLGTQNYIDTFIQNENNQNNGITKWMSVNLSYANSEKNRLQNKSILTKEILSTLISISEGEKVLKRLLLKNNDESQIIICPVHLPNLLEKTHELNEKVKQKNDEATVKWNRPNLPTEYVPASTDLEFKLVEIWEDLLGYKPIGIHDDFFQLGGDSLSMIRLISRIHKNLTVQIAIQVAFENTTVFKLQELILSSPKVNFNAIKKAKNKTYYPQSDTQKRLFLLDQMNSGTIAYNVPVILKIEGNFDIELCNNVFKTIIERHESLRTSHHLINGELVQKIQNEVDFNIENIQNNEERIKKLTKHFMQPFDLATPPLIRVGVKKEKENSAYLIIDMHHIVTDGISYGILIKEFTALYNNEQLVPLKIQYKDFAVWQQNVEREQQLEHQKKFWINEFKNIPETLNLPTDFLRPQINDYKGATIIFEIGKQESKKLKEVCLKHDVTIFTLLLASFNVLLSKLSGQEDVTIGTSTAGRQHVDVEQLIGVFINTLALRNFPKGNQSFKEFLNKVKDTVLESFANQEYSYERLVGQLKLKLDLSHNPLFDVMFEYYNFDSSEFNINGLQLSQIEYENVISKLDLSLRVFEGENTHTFYLDYRTTIFKKETVERFITYYKNILQIVTQNIDINLAEINILPVAETELLTSGYNATSIPYQNESNLVTLLEQEVVLHPDRIAVCCGEKTLTYNELNKASNKVAHYLVLEGIVPGNTVGLLFQRSLDMIVGILGVLKTGGGYLPIDPNLPEQRIGYMLNQSNATYLLTQKNYIEKYCAYLPVQSIDSSKITIQSSDNVAVEIHPTDLAYCIFTSGSSGNPKGVMMNHRSVINLVKGLEERVYKYYGDKVLRVALLASFSFDASVQQIYGSLLQGHSLYIVDEESRSDGHKLKLFYKKNAIDLSDGTPTHLRLLLDALKENTSLGNLSSWILAGETLSKKIVKEFYATVENVQLYNFYGPTETCVDSTSYRINRNSLEDYPFIPIGKPLPNERIYITDTYGNIVPTGVVGELCIAGDGLAQRYVGNGAITSEKFCSNWIKNEKIVYRTGDTARWLPDGNIEYLGRIDDQIKLRGYRIELSEIEHQLSTFSTISHSVVELKESNDDKFLVAYYESSTTYKVADIRQHLSYYLPDYMIPSYFMQMDRLPLTTSGKVDRKSLPNYKIAIEDNYEAPTTKTEQLLVKIWAEVLKLDISTVGVNSNFFDLGGQSLKLVFLANKIRETFNVSLTLTKLVSLKNIRQLAKELKTSVKNTEVVYTRIMKTTKKENYPLSSTQKRFYFLNQLNKKSIVYNQPQTFTLNGAIDRKKIEKIFNTIIDRYDIFRTYFVVVKDMPVQHILEKVDFKLEYFNATLKKSEEIIKNFIRPFDLNTSPLLRACLINISKEKHILIIDRHHIISDGVSLGIFINDFKSLYLEEKLAPVRLQYKDYVIWQQSKTYKKSLERQKNFWNKLYTTIPTLLNLNTDYERPLVPSYKGMSIDFSIDSEQTKLLNDIAKSLNATLYSVILGIFKILLYKLTSQKDLTVGTPVSGRGHTDIESMMGVFINVLALRNRIDDNDNLYDFLKKVNQNAISSFEHQDYPYEKLIKDLNLERNTSHNPLFDVMFVYTDIEPLEMEWLDLKIKGQVIKSNTSQLDLILHVNATKEKINFNFEYATELFQNTTVKNFIKYFKNIVNQVNLNLPINDINILDVEEINVIKTFNSSEISFDIKDDIIGMFEKQVLAFPNRNAVLFNDSALSYKELNERSNQLAAYLINKGVSKGDIVGLILNRSIDVMIGILGILKSGGAYLPIDCKLPLDRINYMLKSSASKIVLGHEEHLDKYKKVVETHCINSSLIKTYSKDNLPIKRNPLDLAYCIFTSGSTGVPKGVLITHANVVNLVEGLSHTVYKGLEPGLRVGLIAAHSFDASCQQIFGAVLKGHSLYICDEKERMDGLELYHFYKNNKIEVSDGTPTHFGMFIKRFKEGSKLPNFKIWLLAGETLPKELVQKFYENPNTNRVVLYNLYGPTETCVDSSFYRINPLQINNFKTIPIGRPLPNERIYIVDGSGNSVPKGVIGELCIAGLGLAKGYLGDAIKNESFTKNWIKGEDKIYRSGDLARWLPDGNIEYIGRADKQVKLRGYRIELEEIEHTIRTHKEIVESAVTLINLKDETYIVAYYVSNQNIESEILREHLQRSLPEYMIPSFFMQLENMPLTTNGKLNKNALPIPNRINKNQYVAPTTKTEQKVVEIWAEVLKLEPNSISTQQSFLQIGGHSLLAIQIANKIKRKFKIEMKLVEIFKKVTVEQQSKFIDANLWINEEDSVQEIGKKEINI